MQGPSGWDEPPDRASDPTTPPSGPRRRVARREGVSLVRLMREPRSAVFFVLVSVFVIGGGRRVWKSWRSRKAVRRLEEPDVTEQAIADSVAYGRDGLLELFRILTEGRDEATRVAAGRALARIWARDEMIAEEEQGLIRRGFRADWQARRRYPRSLQAEIPIVATFGVPFLDANGDGVRPDQLEWSYRVQGAKRASLETFSPWAAGNGRAAFALVPDDFETNGPHRLALHARVRTRGLTDAWEIELPQIPFNFEFDPQLVPEAILAMPEESGAGVLASKIALEPPEEPETAAPTPNFLALNDDLALRNPPDLVVRTPLPCDLAHGLELEFEGLEGTTPAGAVVVAGQGGVPATSPAKSLRRFSILLDATRPGPSPDRPGTRRVRARLRPDPHRGWADPDVRSVWPAEIVTDWREVEIVRR